MKLILFCLFNKVTKGARCVEIERTITAQKEGKFCNQTATLFRNLNCPYLPALIVFNSLPWIWVVLSVPAVKIKIPTKNSDFHYVKRRAIVFEGTTGLEINKKIQSITKICLVLSAVY